MVHWRLTHEQAIAEYIKFFSLEPSPLQLMIFVLLVRRWPVVTRRSLLITFAIFGPVILVKQGI